VNRALALPLLRSAAGRAVRLWGTTALSLLLLLVPVTGRAQARDDGAPAETLGLGDNVRASVWGPAALFFNPAGMSRGRAFLVEGGYSFFEGRDAHAFTASAVDAMTNPYAAMGVAYSYLTGTPGGRDRDGHQFRGALSTGWTTPDVSVYAGVGVRYLSLTLGATDGDNGETDDVDAWTADLGLIFELAQRIRFGVVGTNLVDTHSGEAPRTLGLGLGLLFDTFELTADLDVDLTDADAGAVTRYGFGGQYTIANAFQIRLGATFDPDQDAPRISAGFGYVTAAYAVDLGYAAATSGDSDMLFALSFRYTPPIRTR